MANQLPMEDLYCRNPPFIYLRINGIYYKRTIGKGWEIIEKPDINGKWDPLHPLQYAAYKIALREAGLISSQ